MPVRFNDSKNQQLREEIENFYVRQNKSLGEVAKILKMSESGIYDRLKRYKISICPSKKKKYLNRKTDIAIPGKSMNLAEFTGILLGDGHISKGQVWVSLNHKDDADYHVYVKKLMQGLFKAKIGSMHRGEKGTVEAYLGSTKVVKFFKKMGLVHNKVKEQVKIPNWVFEKQEYQKACLKGLIDTDGSVYRLKLGGAQLSFKNRSAELLKGVRKLLVNQELHPSKISGYSIYLTRRRELDKYFCEIGSSNVKHHYRYLKSRAGSEVANRSGL